MCMAFNLQIILINLIQQIRDMRSRAGRENTTRIIRENVQQLNRDHDILAFLRRSGHQNDGYVVRQIGPYP